MVNLAKQKDKDINLPWTKAVFADWVSSRRGDFYVVSLIPEIKLGKMLGNC